MKYLFCICLACYSFLLNAQIFYGIHAGPNFSHCPKEVEDFSVIKDRIIGVNIGMFFEFSLNKNLSLRPELNFVQKGYKRSLFFNTFVYKFSYFDLPLLLKFQHNIPFNRKGKKMCIYGAFGPYIGIAAYGKSRDIENNYVEKIEMDLEHRDDFGLLASMGLAIPSGRKGSILLDIRYDIGLVEISNRIYSKDVKNRGFILIWPPK